MKISELQAILAAARHKYGDIQVAALDPEWCDHAAICCVEVIKPTQREEHFGQSFLSLSPHNFSNGSQHSVEVLFVEA